VCTTLYLTQCQGGVGCVFRRLHYDRAPSCQCRSHLSCDHCIWEVPLDTAKGVSPCNLQQTTHLIVIKLQEVFVFLTCIHNVINLDWTTFKTTHIRCWYMPTKNNNFNLHTLTASYINNWIIFMWKPNEKLLALQVKRCFMIWIGINSKTMSMTIFYDFEMFPRYSLGWSLLPPLRVVLWLLCVCWGLVTESFPHTSDELLQKTIPQILLHRRLPLLLQPVVSPVIIN